MIILRFLFERNAKDPLMPVISATIERDLYVKQKKKQLRSMLGKSGQNSSEIRQQLKDLEKNKNNIGWGITRF